MTITDKAGSNSGNQPPKAGETRSSLGSESRFIAPLPLPTGQPAFDTDAWINTIDDVNLELGQTSGDKVWSIQVVIRHSAPDS
ncbi:MAG: hypothetical protein II007_04290 [Gammaproteobacteria bacterium]|nr:hypothetical protein [Gammaproteobacteria bacterium]